MCINVVKQRMVLLNDKMRALHSALYWEEQTGRQFFAAEINGMTDENVTEHTE